MANSLEKIKPIPHNLVLVLCILFAILYGVWILPHTVFIRHTCMVLGAILSLWVIYPNRHIFFQKRAIPIWLIALLFVWVTIHLFFIGRDFDAQWYEYGRIWKKIGISSIFAVGLGLAIISQAHDVQKTKRYWQIIYFGFLLPTIIYFVKFGATHYLPQWGYAIPKYLVLSSDHLGDAFGVSRAWYVFYCLPVLAIGLGRILQLLENRGLGFIGAVPYLLTMPCILLIFYLEQDRLGTVLGFLCILLMIILALKPVLKGVSLMKVLALLISVVLSFFILYKSAQQNSAWNEFMSDAKVAIQVASIDNWKNIAKKGLPLNASGKLLSESNYLRISWAIAGSYLLTQNPLGYGKLSLSFAALAKDRWLDTDLNWTHSAWLDFSLGYGLPGLFFLGLATILAWSNSKYCPFPWSAVGRWGLGLMAMAFLVKEISFEAPVNTLIFLIVWVSAMSLGGLSLKRPLKG